MNTQANKQGFTIIEVVLVLAIAALIFLMIFIALPALQRGQRDTARKQDANTVASAVSSYRGNNRGSLPDASDFNTEFRNSYVKELGQYETTAVSAQDEGDKPTASNLDVEEMLVRLGVGCDGNESSRVASVFVHLEASDAIVCTDA